MSQPMKRQTNHWHASHLPSFFGSIKGRPMVMEPMGTFACSELYGGWS